MTRKNYLFIDDSGSKEWETPHSHSFIETPPSRNDQNRNFWLRNYFVLAGLHISAETIAKLNPQIDALKKQYFGTKHVEIKSEWMRNPHQRKKRYLDPFGITEDDLKKFTDEWYQIFTDNIGQIQIQAFVLDKRFYKNKRSLCTPLQVLTQVLFDRVELHPAKECSIVFDQMDREIRSEKHAQGDILKISSKEVDLGSFHKKYSHAKPEFEKSKNSNFLQLADTTAYNVLRQFVDHGDKWEKSDEKDSLPMYSFFKKISGNFYHRNGRIAGIGIVKVPDREKLGWSMTKEE